MIGPETEELYRLISEPSTYTGRPAATVLLARAPGSACSPDRAFDAICPQAPRCRIDTAGQSHVRTLVRMMAEAFRAGQPVMIELACDPHPDLFRLLKRASRDGLYPYTSPDGASSELKPIPAGCPIVVLADRCVIDEGITHPNLISLFEIIENV